MTRVLVLASALLLGLAGPGVFASTAIKKNETGSWADVAFGFDMLDTETQTNFAGWNLIGAHPLPQEAPSPVAPPTQQETPEAPSPVAPPPRTRTARLDGASKQRQGGGAPEWESRLRHEAKPAPTRRQDPQCWDCGECGHKSADCPKKTPVDTRTQTEVQVNGEVSTSRRGGPRHERRELERREPNTPMERFIYLLDKAEDEIVGPLGGRGQSRPRAPKVDSFVFPNTYIPEGHPRYTTEGSGSPLRGFQVYLYSIRICPLGGTTWLPFPQG